MNSIATKLDTNATWLIRMFDRFFMAFVRANVSIVGVHFKINFDIQFNSIAVQGARRMEKSSAREMRARHKGAIFGVTRVGVVVYHGNAKRARASTTR